MRNKNENVSQDTKSSANQINFPVFHMLKKSKHVLVLFALSSFLIPFTIAIYSLHSKMQLGTMDGMAEEYLTLGINHYKTGKYEYEQGRNFFFRPPGYPYFISFALLFYSKAPGPEEKFNTSDKLSDFYDYLYVVHTILFSFTVLIFFLIVLRFHNQLTAFILALLFGCNPYFLIHLGLFHYEILHIFLLSSGTFFLIKTVNHNKLQYIWLIISGLLFGLATLVRPITLILPFFVFIALIFIENKKFIPAAVKVLIFSFCMLIIIAPYTWRNYQLSNSFIPVNAQAGVAFWSGTVKPLPIEPNHYRWWEIWHTEGMPIYEKVTGTKEINKYSWARNNLDLEKEFTRQAVTNIRKQPFTYIYNIMINFISINFCINSAYIKIFEYIQLPGNKFKKSMLRLDNNQKFQGDLNANILTMLVIFLTVCSAFGIYWGIKHYDSTLITILALYLCIIAAHSITHMDFMYYYIKMPFIFIFFAFFLKYLPTPKNKAGFYIKSIALTFPLILTASLLFNVIIK